MKRLFILPVVIRLAADSKGNIYTAEIGQGRRAQKFVPTR